jgi:hypothetical protein
MSQLIQVAGALAILVAFPLAQFHVLDQHSFSYLTLNLAGAVVLAVAATTSASGASFCSRSYGRRSRRGRSSAARGPSHIRSES